MNERIRLEESLRLPRGRLMGLERTAYVAGWWYGLFCGLVCGCLTTGLAWLLLHLAAQAWVAAPAAKAVSLLGVTT